MEGSAETEWPILDLVIALSLGVQPSKKQLVAIQKFFHMDTDTWNCLRDITKSLAKMADIILHIRDEFEGRPCYVPWLVQTMTVVYMIKICDLNSDKALCHLIQIVAQFKWAHENGISMEWMALYLQTIHPAEWTSLRVYLYIAKMKNLEEDVLRKHLIAISEDRDLQQMVREYENMWITEEYSQFATDHLMIKVTIKVKELGL
jgi:hypothetical protein